MVAIVLRSRAELQKNVQHVGAGVAALSSTTANGEGQGGLLRCARSSTLSYPPSFVRGFRGDMRRLVQIRGRGCAGTAWWYSHVWNAPSVHDECC